MADRQTTLLRGRISALIHLAACAATLVLTSDEVQAQGPGCLLQPTGIPTRQVVRCRDGLTFEAAAGADYTLLDHGRDGIPDAASLRSGALLVDAPPHASRVG